MSAFQAPGPTAFRWTHYATDNGAGPDVRGNAGIALDDIGLYGPPALRGGEAESWGRVRSLYR